MTALSPEAIMQVSPIIPVIAIDDVERAVDLAHALQAGGVNILEITLRTPTALSAIERLADKVPDAVLGAGTVTQVDDLQRVRDAGATFAISPGSTEAILSAAKAMNFPLLPGVATGSEIMQGLALDYQHFKLFPAEIAGGIGALKAFAGPFHAVKFCPTGGVSEQNFVEYLNLPNVLCVGGSWIVPQSLISAGNFDEITRLTASALAIHQEQCRSQANE